MEKWWIVWKFFKLGWHWFIWSCRFQVYVSTMRDLYSALCAHTQCQIILCHHIFGPLYPLLHPHSLPSGNHHAVVCLWECQFYIPHMSEVKRFLAFSDWLISLSIIFSRFIHVVANGTVPLFVWLSSIRLYICTTSRLSNYLPKDIWLSPCLGHCE